jgi:hypothetical protein
MVCSSAGRCCSFENRAFGRWLWGFGYGQFHNCGFVERG